MLLLDFINVGYGDAILIRDTEEPFTMLVDCGDVSVGNGGPDSKRIPASDYLRREGIETLDLLVLTHLHRDHSGGLAEVISAARVRELWTNYLPQESDWGRCIAVPENFSAGSRCLLQSLNIFLDTLKTLQAQGARLRLRSEHQANFPLTKNLFAELHTEAGKLRSRQEEIWSDALDGKADDQELQELDGFINNTSLRLSLRYGGHRIELPGDMYAACWETHDLPHCDILKLPHHGHRDALSPCLLEMLRPAHTVISVSNTRTDMCPHPEVIQLLRQTGSQVYFTDAVRGNGWTASAQAALRFQISNTQGLIFNMQR
ncbi:ComEC/Rec2 family competence protein [uncultured Oscillibacter sp.]|nr:MBL fold metallo-hydrolase [uncultured Oscillibacter sp.]